MKAFLILNIAVFLLFVPAVFAGETDFLDQYHLQAERIKVKKYRNFTKSWYKAKFIFRGNASQAPHVFKDHNFILFQAGRRPEGIRPQLTIVFPNLSPIRRIDERTSRRLVEKGSDVLLLETGITLFSYAKELSDFNHIIRGQMLAGRLALSFALSELKTPPLQIQVLGVSLGAILSAAILSLDDRVSAGIMYMGGAGYKGSKELGFVADVTRFLQGRSKSPSEGITLDAENLAEGFAGKRALVYRTSRDGIVPVERQKDLEALLDKPEVRLLRGMHVKNAFYSPLKADEFFTFFNPETL